MKSIFDNGGLIGKTGVYGTDPGVFSLDAAYGYQPPPPGWAAGEFDYTAHSATQYGGNQTSYSDTVSIGAADSDRWLIIAAMAEYNTTSTPTVTVGGSSATEMFVFTNTGTRNSKLGFWKIAYPTGTTATVQINVTDSCERFGFGVWRVIGEPDLFDSATNYTTGNTATGSVDCAAGGATIGFCCTQNKNAMSWTNVTEDFDLNYSTGERISGGTVLTESDETGRSVSVDATASGTDYIKLIVGSFQRL